jgi:F0F1-type ATP synthase delta subunit
VGPNQTLKLPNNLVSQVDVARVIRELNSLNDFFISSEARKSGTPMTPPRLTRQLDQLARDNGINLLESAHRQQLYGWLNESLGNAPLIHISFAAEPSTKALDVIVIWFRSNIHPQALLQVGLQPTIAAGCVVRTANRVFDMSMRSYLKKQEPYLVELIAGAARGGK